MPRHFSLVALATVGALFAGDAQAQALPTPLLQLSVGVGSSTGGDYEERQDYVAELLLARPLRASSRGGLLAGLAGGATFVNGSDLTCRLRRDGSCAPIMPRFGYLNAVLGVARAGALGTASVALGPGVALGGSGRTHPSLQYRVDYSTPARRGVALAIAGRGLAVANVDGATLVLRSVTVGLRLGD